MEKKKIAKAKQITATTIIGTIDDPESFAKPNFMNNLVTQPVCSDRAEWFL